MNEQVTTTLLAVTATGMVALAVWLGLSASKGEKPAVPRDSDPLDPW